MRATMAKPGKPKGIDLAKLLTLKDFRAAARRALPTKAFDYYRSGADDERTLRRNRRAYRELEIHYRVLRDVAERDLSTTVLGAPLRYPVMIAPTAYQRMAHEDGELGTARAAHRAGTVMVVSTLATTTLEEIAAETPAPKWFQLYVHRDRSFTRELVARAEAAGYAALCLTVDTPVLGRRLRDERNGFGLPRGLTMANLASATSLSEHRGSMLARYVASRHDASLTWSDVEWLQGITRLPLVLKGVVRGDDADRACSAGARGVLVSNHGARQLDGAPATIDVLPAVVEAVAGRAEVLVDGGVRWGTDVLKALAMGARAVLVGRPVLWGLAVGGEAGVLRVLELLYEELERAMALAGARSLAELDADLVRRREG
jgi:isopentenyl diphosphate isomerase/L-lactate dehydrogenase-like FMN-dependent dehydrogenase